MVSLPLRLAPLLLATVFGAFLIGSFLYQDVLPYQFPKQWQPTAENLNRDGAYDPTAESGEYLGQAVHSTDVSTKTLSMANVLGDSDATNKHIEVDLANQKVYAFEGDAKVMEFTVSTGKWGKTPIGHFTIQYKTLAQRMAGGSKALHTYYNLPNVQFVQFFGNDEIPWSQGFSFHGAYWHNNFGHPMSHGCINMKNADAEKLFYWTTPVMGSARTIKATNENPGTPVFIYGEAPAN
jgi:hypothetical protein